MGKIESVITPGFTKEDRSSFKYWFAHYCAYNMTALNLKCWKWRFLFHDFEKPWLKLIFKDYKKVQKWHREHSRHHITSYAHAHNNDYSKCDWLGAVIDWECSRYTKQQAGLNAREEIERKLRNEDGKYTEYELELFKTQALPLVNKLNI